MIEIMTVAGIMSGVGIITGIMIVLFFITIIIEFKAGVGIVIIIGILTGIGIMIIIGIIAGVGIMIVIHNPPPLPPHAITLFFKNQAMSIPMKSLLCVIRLKSSSIRNS